MHYSAIRGVATAIDDDMSVRLSVTLLDQDHIRLEILKLTAQTISLTSSLFVVQRPFTYSQGNMGKFWGKL